MTPARVSVLMTIYNAGPYLAPAIDSLLAQTFPHWELIAVENGSADGSHQLLKAYRDDRIKIHRFEKNIGRTAALRYAFEHANGELIAVLDADDTSHPSRLQRQVEFLDANPGVALVASWAHYIDKAGDVIGTFTPPTSPRDITESFGHSNPIAHSSAMYRRSAAQQVGGYPSEFTWAQDLALFIRLAGQHAVAILPQFLCAIRIQHSNMSTSPEYRGIVLDERIRLFEMTRQHVPLSQFGRLVNRGATSFARLKKKLNMAEAFVGAPGILLYVAMKVTRYRYTRLPGK